MKLEFVDIHKTFGDKEVLHGINFSVESGKMFGYLGRNGAGKTTSIRILMDVFHASSGEILVDGKPFHPRDFRIGYLPEERGMYAKSKIMDQLMYFAVQKGATRKEAKESILYWAERFQISQYLNVKLETLSKGNQQKVQITQAFLNNPDILILDEPFSGLDPVNSKVFQDALEEYISSDRMIIFSSHQMGYIESFCDSIAIINNGSIVLKGSLEEIKAERGKNRIEVRVAGVDADSLQAELQGALGVPIEVSKQNVILTLSDSVKKKDVLSYLTSKDYDITLFTNYEPSLQDIFIQEVGDHDETIA